MPVRARRAVGAHHLIDHSGPHDVTQPAALVQRRAFGGWREGVLWRRGHVVVDSTGAVDPPGATWHDRPAVDQGDDVYLAGDAVAAPGLLSEVAVNSGVQAARLALDARRRRTFAPGWPSAHLTPERRFAVLAAVVPGASLDTAVVTDGGDRRWEIAPVDETGPGYRLHARGRVLRGMAVTASPGGVRVTTLGSSRWPEPAASVPRLFGPAAADTRHPQPGALR